ncbi:MAG: hypothetical protein ACE145_10085 [Terriglobia bacterium]
MVLNLDERPIHPGSGAPNEQEPRNSERSSHAGSWFAFGLLVCALVAAAVYGYRVLRETGVGVAQLPAILRSTADLSTRVQAAEKSLAASAADRRRIGDRMNSLDREVKSGLRQATKHADKATQQLEARIEDQMDERSAVVDERVNKLEAAQAANRAQFDQLRADLDGARQEIAALRQSSEGQFASLSQRAEGSDRAVASLEHRLDRQKVAFEAARNHHTQITPGVNLKVTDTDVSRQQFSGWIQLVSEGRFLWVNEQGVKRPVEFFRQSDIREFDVVITRVNRDSVVGYLLKPAADEKAGGPLARLKNSELPAH